VADEEERLLTTSQVAREFGINRTTLGNYVRRGWLRPTVTLPSGHHRWLLSDVREQLRELRERAADDE
jgi:predicted site-specific integrase-resolvase